MDGIRRIIRESIGLAENIQQADKIYFNTGLLSPEDKQNIISITGGDYFTRLVSDWYYHLTKVWNQKNDKYFIPMVQEFHNNLKSYNKNIFPVAGNLEDYSAQAKDRDKHVLELYSMLKERANALKQWELLPTLAKRNLNKIARTPYNNEYYFSDIAKKLRDLNHYLERMPKPGRWDDEETKERKADKLNKILNKIFASTNSLEQMVANAEQFAMAFNLGTGEIGKDEIIDNLKYIEADLIQNSGDILVVRANDQEAMEKLGCTSLWCFSRPGAQGDWETYAPLGYAYVIYDFNKEFEDAAFMMTYLPDSGALYSSSNVSMEELGINNTDRYLKHIGVDVNKLHDTQHIVDRDEEDSEEESEDDYQYDVDDENSKKIDRPYVDPNQLQLNLNEIRKMIKNIILKEV